MTDLNLFPVFMIGLLGSVHCVGMCGGIVGAFSLASKPARRFPLAVVSVVDGVGSSSGAGAIEGALRVISYNIGRISSYAMAGAMVGGIASGARTLAGISTMQLGGYWLANLMLVALGLYLMDLWRGLAQLEAAGQILWRKIQPMTKYLMPLDSFPKLLLLGGLWGWLPCGMVYSMLLTAMLTGSALSGARVMLVFGLGTLPTLLAMGLFGAQLRTWMQRRPVRLISGLIVLGFGILGLVRAANGLPMSWMDSMCVSTTS
jgi:sulfite exporter TauE/SafE